MSNNFCKHCGAKLDEDAKFCPSCGKPVETGTKNVIKCEDCGREFPSSNDVCPYCGCPADTASTPLQQIQNFKTPVENTRNGRNYIKSGLITALAIFVIIGGFFGFTYLKKQQHAKDQFASAVTLYNSGDYNNALQICETFDDNVEAEDLANKCRYQIGMAAYTAKSWSDAIEAFQTISVENYGNTKELITRCEEEITKEKEEKEDAAKRERSADDKFLKDLESVVKSILQNNILIPDESLAINNLNILSNYRSAEFYDNKLKNIANNIITGLEIQLMNLQTQEKNMAYRNEKQRIWYESYIEIAKELCKLYDSYGFMNDNAVFKDTFIKSRKSIQNISTKLGIIEELIYHSLNKNGSWQVDDNNNGCMLISNTINNTMSIKFYYTDYVQGTKQYLGEDTFVIYDIPRNTDFYIYKYAKNYEYSFDTTVTIEWEVLSII